MWQFQPLRLLALTLGLALAAVPATASAQQMWSDGASGKMTEADLLPHLSSAEAYIERYNFNGDLDGGGRIGVKFIISNMGWGDLQGAVRIHLRLPDHGTYEFEEKLARNKWSVADDELRISIADTTVTRPEEGKFRIEHSGDRSFEVTFENRLPMWRPGNGKIEAGDSYYSTQLLAPRASIEGSATIGGQTVEFASESDGFAEHTATNVAPYNVAKRFAWFRTFDDKLMVMWKYADLTENFGGSSIAWIVVGYNRRIVFSHTDATVTFGEKKPDGPSGYRVPTAAQVEASDGGDSVKYVHRGSAYDRQDLMKQWGAIARSVASSLTSPYRFEIPGTYTFEMSIQGATAQVGAKSHFTIDILND